MTKVQTHHKAVTQSPTGRSVGETDLRIRLAFAVLAVLIIVPQLLAFVWP